MKAVYLLAAITISVTSFSAYASEIKRIDYESFTVWVDCDKRSAVKFQYNAQHDTGKFYTLINTLVVTSVLNRFTLTLMFLHHTNNSPLNRTNRYEILYRIRELLENI